MPDDMPVLYERHDGLAVIRLNRPEKRNSLFGQGIVEELVAVLRRLPHEQQLRAAILTGAGDAFCVGAHLKEFEALQLDQRSAAEIKEFYRTGVQQIPLAFADLDVPVIAAVNGPAIGAGCDIACMCDIRIASETASFAEAFVKLGTVPGDGGAWVIPEIIGMSRYMEMALTGDPITAEEAYRIGMVSRVVTPERLMDEAIDVARRIAVNPPLAVRMTKRLVRQAARKGLEEHLDLAATSMAICHHTNDHREAVHAYLERRAPVFKGH